MAQKEGQGHGDRQLLFSKLDHLSGNVREFSVIMHTSPERTLFKMGLDDQTQFTSEIATPDFCNSAKAGNIIELLFCGLFTKEKIVGKMTMDALMHDAAPASLRLGSFFNPDKASTHCANPPRGMNCGGVVFGARVGDTFRIAITDIAERGMSGVYELAFTGEKKKDSKGREATVIKMRKVDYFMARNPVPPRRDAGASGTGNK